MRYLIAALAALVTFTASAAEKSWTWANPTTNTDNTPIPATGAGSLASGRLEFGTCGTGGAFGTKAGEVSLTLAQVQARTATVTNLLPQTICARVYVRNTYGNESPASNVSQAVIPAPTPGPATGLTAVETVAYEMRPRSDGTVVAARIGLIDIGTICSPEYMTAGNVRYHRIELRDTDLVNWPTNLKSPTAWARCG